MRTAFAADNLSITGDPKVVNANAGLAPDARKDTIDMITKGLQRSSSQALTTAEQA